LPGTLTRQRTLLKYHSEKTEYSSHDRQKGSLSLDKDKISTIDKITGVESRIFVKQQLPAIVLYQPYYATCMAHSAYVTFFGPTK
jgi:hypothetical protein